MKFSQSKHGSKLISDYLVISLSWITTTAKLRRGDGLQRVTRGENKSDPHIVQGHPFFRHRRARARARARQIFRSSSRCETKSKHLFFSLGNLLGIIGVSEKSRATAIKNDRQYDTRRRDATRRDAIRCIFLTLRVINSRDKSRPLEIYVKSGKHFRVVATREADAISYSSRECDERKIIARAE